MTMFITYDTREMINMQRELHIPFSREQLRGGLDEIHPGMVTAVQADGDELQAIRSGLSNLPENDSNRVATWYGDHAKFIVGNLFR